MAAARVLAAAAAIMAGPDILLRPSARTPGRWRAGPPATDHSIRRVSPCRITVVNINKHLLVLRKC